jgi:hypothetical protein
MYINTRVRHYWSQVTNKQFYTLQPDGHLLETNNFTGNADQNYNFFTVDAGYTWEFAPGSFIYLVWKNAAEDFNQQVNENYFKNFSKTMSADESNNLSLKIIYFLDYLDFRKKFRKKK